MVFEWPLVLLSGLVLLPVLTGYYLYAQRKRRSYAVRFTNLELLVEVAGPGPGLRRHVPPIFYLLGAGILFFGMARPHAVIHVPKEQAAVVLAIDVSGSMTAEDLYPNRMEAARQSARVFMKNIPASMQVGLVSFRDSAIGNVPLTRDRDQLLAGIDRLQPNGSTAVGEAVFLSLEMLASRETDTTGEPGPAMIVLLTDGESNRGRAPQDAAAAVKNENIPIYTIGIGKRGGVTYLNSGQAVGLDESTLIEIAQLTGGQYFYAAESNTLEDIYLDISSQIGWVEEKMEITALASAAGTLLILIGGFLSLRWFQQFP